MKIAVVLLAVCTALAGCLSAPRLSVEGATAANEPNSSLHITAGETPSFDSAKGLPTLFVTATNTTSAPEAFGPENFSITAAGHAVRIYSGAELDAAIRKQANFRRYAAETRAELQAQAIEQDPAPPVTNRTAIEVRTNGMQESAAATWAERRALSSLHEILVSTELKPGETITRRLVLHPEDLRGVANLEVHVRLGEVDHVFAVQVSS